MTSFERTLLDIGLVALLCLVLIAALVAVLWLVVNIAEDLGVTDSAAKKASKLQDDIVFIKTQSINNGNMIYSMQKKLNERSNYHG